MALTELQLATLKSEVGIRDDKTHYGTGAMLTLMWLAIGTAAVLAVASIVVIVIVEAGR